MKDSAIDGIRIDVVFARDIEAAVGIRTDLSVCIAECTSDVYVRG
jgi:hypothetical protein